jgi:hypothetical protein
MATQTTETTDVIEHYAELNAEAKRIREAIRATQVDERTGTPLALATASAQRHELGVAMNANDEARRQIAGQAYAAEQARARMASDDLASDPSYKESVAASCLALCASLESAAVVYAMGINARHQGLTMLAQPRVLRSQVEEAVGYVAALVKRGYVSVESLAPVWTVLVEGSL